jgi:hypothetical protein
LQDLPTNAAVLPPRREGAGPVYTLLQNDTLGLPPETAVAIPAEDYKPKLGVDYAGQPVIGVGKDPFGTYAVGGISMVFSDMLGNHTLYTGAQVTNRFDEFGATAAYINRTHRWNWGASIDQTPYVWRSYTAGVGVSQGVPVYVENESRFLQIDRSVGGLISYPFSRALRVDFSGGGRNIAYKQDVRSRTYDFNSGQQIAEDTTELPSPDDLLFGEGSAALVFDTSIMGATSPIRGSRYRLELGQSAGNITFTNLTADVRTYLMPVKPYTFAFRGLYYARYGNEAEDFRLPTLYLGYPGLVRGYAQGSFETGECGLQPDGSCPTFDRLLGSRVAIFNAELRFPLWGALTGGRGSFYGPLPVEMAVFADSGVAWGQSTSVLYGGNQKEPVSSVGLAWRVNLMGFAVAEIDWVRPLDRPGRGWLWQFNLIPGF